MEEREQQKKLKQEIVTADKRIADLVVNGEKSFMFAGEMVIELDGLRKKIVEYWQGPKEAAFLAHKSIVEKEKEMLAPVDTRRAYIKKLISIYLTEKEAERRKEQARLDEERRQREQAERERLERRAEKAEEKGNAEKAEALREKAQDVFVPPTIVQPEIEKTTALGSGSVTQTTRLEVVVTDPMQVLRHIIEGVLPIGIVEFSDAKLKAAIKLGNIKQLPGLTIREVVSANFRGSK